MSNFELYLMERSREERMERAWLKVAIGCSIGAFAVGGVLGFGITYGVMKNKDKKQEPQVQTQVEESIAQIKNKGYELSFNLGEEKVSANDYFENEMSL